MIMLFRRMGTALRKRQFGQMFYEFMLIFLAVMAGFAAENWRENLEDKKRLKEYLVSMRNDLQADLQEAQRINQINLVLEGDVAYIMDHLYGAQTDSTALEVYTKARFLARQARWIKLQDQAYEQMKSAGDLRLVANGALVDSMGSYYAQAYLLSVQLAGVTEEVASLQVAEKGVFDSGIFFSLARGDDAGVLRGQISAMNQPRPKQAAVESYRHTLQQMFGSMNNHRIFLKGITSRASQLEAQISAELKKLE